MRRCLDVGVGDIRIPDSGGGDHDATALARGLAMGESFDASCVLRASSAFGERCRGAGRVAADNYLKLGFGGAHTDSNQRLI